MRINYPADVIRGKLTDVSISCKTVSSNNFMYLTPIDLVLTDQQNIGKRRLHLKDTINAKKKWTTFYWRANKFLKESHIVTRFAKERVSFFKN
jgi:hypothetical protein